MGTRKGYPYNLSEAVLGGHPPGVPDTNRAGSGFVGVPLAGTRGAAWVYLLPGLAGFEALEPSALEGPALAPPGLAAADPADLEAADAPVLPAPPLAKP